MKKEYDPYVIN